MAELLSVSPSPSKDQDVFGKELRISESERKQLAAAGEIFLSKTVQVSTKKGDGTEPRTLVISSSRCYILVQNPATKLETSFNFLRIQELNCSENKLVFHLSGESRARELQTSRRDSVEVVSLITAQLRNVFPSTPLDMFLKLTFDPDSLRQEVSTLRDELTTMMERVDASSIQGFLIAYGFLCDFFNVEYSKEVSWFLNNVYLAHGVREIKLSDFDHFSSKEFLPVVSSLRHNSFFEGITDKDDKLVPEVVEELAHVLNSSHSLKTLVLSNCALRPEAVIRLSSLLKNNPRASLTHLNLSDNPLDDRAVEALGSAIESLPHGLQHLILANCKISVKGATALANSMKQNKYMQFTLVELDLSGNPLGPDPLGALGFVQDTQTISVLRLSGCNLLLEHVIPLLNRGCTQHLCELNLSNNTGKGKKVVHSSSVASGIQQFCSSAIAIRSVNLSNCKLSNAVVVSLLEGLAVNPNVTTVKLNISSNDLSGAGSQQMLTVVGKVSCLESLDISDCSLDNNMPHIVAAVTANKKLCHLKVGRNFSGKNAVKATSVAQLAGLLAKEDCQLLSLSVEDSHLKELTPVLLEAVVEGCNLITLNLSGNQMGLRGARSLAKALLCNCSLSEVSWDRNETPLRGFQDVAAAMQQNYTLRVMPLPLTDINRLGKGVEEHVQLIQQSLCRNHSDERLKVEMAARHRTRLLTASQQSSTVSRELVQLGDLLQWVQANFPDHQFIGEGLEVKELANRAIKLTDGLYSPQVESEQFQTITKQVKEVLDLFMENLFTEHIKTMSERMVGKSVKICDTLLSEELRQKLQGLVLEEKGVEFTQAKKDVLRHALPEIVNHVSDSNVDVAANISELVVEYTLGCLEKINQKLSKLQKETQAKNQQTADAKVSRNFTFRVQQEENSPTKKKKKRVRRPDPEDDDEVGVIELPSKDLETTGPALQHLGKTRPKPARMQRRPPSKKAPSSDTKSETTVPSTDRSSSSTPPQSHAPPQNSTPPQPTKVAMKPPPPQVAEKKIKEFLETKSRQSTVYEEKKAEQGGSGSEPASSEVSPVPSPDTARQAEDHVKGAEESKAATVSGDTRATSEEKKVESVEDKVGEPSEKKNDSDGGTVSERSLSEERGLSEERSASEDVEEHRTVMQQQEVLSADDKEVCASPSSQPEGDETDTPAPQATTPTLAGVKEDKPGSPVVKEAGKEAGKKAGKEGGEGSVQSGDKRNSADKGCGDKGEEPTSISDWEVIEEAPQKDPSDVIKKPSPSTAGERVSPSPSPEIIKKPPPVVKEKPRKHAEAAHKDSSDKGILPSSQMASLANVLQKGPLKPKTDSPEEGKGSPAKQEPNTQDLPRPIKSTPSPAPKPRPKPTIRKKAEDKGGAE